eukprot:3271503-Prymnesium_polylepis.1
MLMVVSLPARSSGSAACQRGLGRRVGSKRRQAPQPASRHCSSSGACPASLPSLTAPPSACGPRGASPPLVAWSASRLRLSRHFASRR